MTEHEAKAEAQKRWGENADAVTYNVPMLKRCVGVNVSKNVFRTHGSGKTWKEAFANADQGE